MPDDPNGDWRRRQIRDAILRRQRERRQAREQEARDQLQRGRPGQGWVARLTWREKGALVIVAVVGVGLGGYLLGSASLLVLDVVSRL